MLHVLPSGSGCSLRRTLLLWLVPVFVLVAGVSALLATWSYHRTVGAFLDDQMRLLADSLADSLAGHPQAASPVAVSRDQAHRWGSLVVQVFGSGGELIATNCPEVAVGPVPAGGFSEWRDGGDRWRVYAAGGQAAAGVTAPQAPAIAPRVQVLQSMQFRQHVITGRVLSVLLPALALLLLMLAVLWLFARALSRDVGSVAREVARQDEHSLRELPLARVPQEMAPLVVAFNSLVARLRDAFANQRRFVQDAAHELRTPIAAVSLQLETLRADVCCGATEERFNRLEAGVRRAQRLVDQMLRLSRQEGGPEAAASEVDLVELVRDSVHALLPLADQRRIDLGLVPGGPHAATLRCAPTDLRSALDNLIDNALRHTPEGGQVDVRLSGGDDDLCIEVIDSGPGIPPQLLERVFDRFFRVPGNDTPGSGLGLSIAQAAAQRCGLRLTLHNRDDGPGLVARLTLA